QPRLDRLGLQAEQLGSLLDAHVLDDAGDQYGAERVWQLVDGAFEQRMNLTLGHGALGIDLLAGERDNFAKRRRSSPGASFCPLSQFLHRTLTPQAAERLVDDDAPEPGTETRLATERRQVGKATQVGLLQHVLGFGVVADDAASQPVEPAIVA